MIDDDWFYFCLGCFLCLWFLEIAEESAAGAEEASAAVEEQTSSMEETAQSAQELSGIAEKLQAVAARFKLDSSAKVVTKEDTGANE